MDNRKIKSKFSSSFLDELNKKIGQTPKSIKSNNIQPQLSTDFPPDDLPPVYISDNDLPPDDLPPELTDKQLIGEEGRKILLRLEKRMQDFFIVGEKISDQADWLPEVLEAKLTHLPVDKVALLSDNGFALTIFIQNVKSSIETLSKLNNPFPAVTEMLNAQSSLKFYDILKAYNLLQESIINPEYNGPFKMRAIQCFLLSLAYDKLLASPLDIQEFSSAFISPFQRVAQLALFASDALKELTLLKECVSEHDQESIAAAIINLQDLLLRAKLIGVALDSIKNAIDMVTLHSSQYKRYSEDSLMMLQFIVLFIPKIVAYVMEEKFQNFDEFKQQIINMIESEFAAVLHENFITPSDKIYRELSVMLGKSTSNLKEEIKKLLDVDLRKIHENSNLDESEKTNSMKQMIKDTFNNIAESLNKRSIFSSRKDAFADDLLAFIKNDFSTPPQLSSNVNMLGNSPRLGGTNG